MGTFDYIIMGAFVCAGVIMALTHKVPTDTEPLITNYDTGIDIARELYREACEFAKVTFDLRHSIEKGYDLQEDYRLYDYHEALFLDKCGQFRLWCENRGIASKEYENALEGMGDNDE